MVRLPATMIALLALAILLVRHERAARDRRVAETCRGWQRAIAEIRRHPGSPRSAESNTTVMEDVMTRMWDLFGVGTRPGGVGDAGDWQESLK